MKHIIKKDKFGPWAVITGASSGIGKEFARRLASDGLNVVLIARRLPLLVELGNTLAKTHGIQYLAIEADLSNPNAIENIIEKTGHLQIGLLVSNAGAGKPVSFLTVAEHDLLYTLQLNAVSHLRLAHHFAGKMAARKKGGILLTGAMGAIDGVPYMSNEAATKGYIQSLGKSLNTELQPLGINVTVLVTSPTITPILGELGFTIENSPMKPLSVEQCVDEALAALAVNRATIIPGLKFRIMNRLIPGAVSRKIMASILKKNNGITL